jgi:membrane-bound lytic murein transglycosylase D
MWVRARWWGVLLLGAVVSAPLAWAEPPAVSAAETSPFPVPPALATPVAFWKQIFGTYSVYQVVIHDALYLDRIYAVVDLRTLADSGLSDADIEGYAADRVQSEKERVRAALMHLSQAGPDAEELSGEEQKIRALFPQVNDATQFLEAAADDRIRAQRGLRERFAAGVEVSRRYLPQMEAVFRREGLPVELTRLPLVESCFNVHAYSKVGAAGIWQFMPATARRYMTVNNAVDDRRDPIASTEAAARHLRGDYEALGTWPLAITAYNHGRAGMERAVDTVGSSDFDRIVQEYHGPAFKFASRNFYAEFLAALDVEQHFEDYFGVLQPHRPLRTETVVLPHDGSFKAVAHSASMDPETLADLNPALTREVLSGKLYVPKGYELHLPPGKAASFKARYASVPVPSKAGRRRRAYVTHRVRSGQTLTSIAKRYGTTPAAIKRRNNLHKGQIRTGQNLIIPTQG